MSRSHEPFQTEEQLAELLQYEPRKMARLRREKKLPHTRLSKYDIRYSPEQVEQIKAILSVEPAPAVVPEVPRIGARTAASARRKKRAS